MAVRRNPTAYSWLTANDVPSPDVTDNPANPEDPDNMDEEVDGDGDEAEPIHPDSTGAAGFDDPEPEPEPEPKRAPARAKPAAASKADEEG